jgi:hypothetical protein
MKPNETNGNQKKTCGNRMYLDMSPDFVFISDLVSFDGLNRWKTITNEINRCNSHWGRLMIHTLKRLGSFILEGEMISRLF